MKEFPRLGAKVRAPRRRENLSQARMAERLGISPSYLNLIEHNRRPLSAQVLIRIAQEFNLDLKAFSGGDDERLVADLLEVFGERTASSGPSPRSRPPCGSTRTCVEYPYYAPVSEF